MQITSKVDTGYLHIRLLMSVPIRDPIILRLPLVRSSLTRVVREANLLWIVHKSERKILLV